MNCAIYRMILRPQENSRAFLRLGADELRVAGVILVYTLVWTLVLFLTMATALMGGVFGGPVAAFLGSVLTAAAGFYSVLWVLVRLSLAAPISFAEQRFTLAASWAITRGQFWRLFGTYVLAFALGVVTLVLMWVVVLMIEVVILMIGGVPLTAVGAPSANPAIFVAGLFSQTALAMMATCYRVIMKSPAAITCQNPRGTGAGKPPGLGPLGLLQRADAFAAAGLMTLQHLGQIAAGPAGRIGGHLLRACRRPRSRRRRRRLRGRSRASSRRS